MPYAACSCANQPAPRPSSTRPPDIWSTCATWIASTPGCRNVADETSVPSRMRLVSRASPASVVHASVGPGSPSPSPCSGSGRSGRRRRSRGPPWPWRRRAGRRSVAPCWGSVKMRRSMPTTLTQVDPETARRATVGPVIPAIVTGRHPADEPFAVADWRRRVAEIYADVRRLAVRRPRRRARRLGPASATTLLAEHPASPLDAVAKASFEGLDVPHHDAGLPVRVRDPAPPPAQRLDVSTGRRRRGAVRAHRRRRAGRPGAPLAVWVIRGYGGGLLRPVKDALAGTPAARTAAGGTCWTPSRGRISAWRQDRLVIDLNFAYNPSCAYDPAWTCPLATRANTLAVDVPVGERMRS